MSEGPAAGVPAGAERPASGTPASGVAAGRAPAGSRAAADARSQRRAERAIAACFVVSLVAGLVVLGVYVAGGQTQAEGVLLAVCLGGLGAGIVLWSQRLLPQDLVIEERHPAESAGSAEAVAEIREEELAITRRRMLVGLLATAIAGLGAALAIPVFSLGPDPGRAMFASPWKRGSRLVGLDQQPVRADAIPVDGVMTVFPEGQAGSASGQAILIRVDPGLLHPSPERADWSPAGFLCFSKTCTHAGCSVGLYRASEHRLICPCHQSTFDVLDGAKPTFGPAVRPLPQLPITLQPDGTFAASGGFSGPIGPSTWNIGQG